MIKYIITGATGWIGQNIINDLLLGSKDYDLDIKLKKNEKIRCLLLKSEEIPKKFLNSKIEIVHGDLKDKNSLSPLFYKIIRPTLIHLAGIIHPKFYASDFNKINFEGTKNLIEVSKQFSLKKIIVLSSNSPIGCNPSDEHVFVEESIYNPYMKYGESKFKMELYLKNIIMKNNNSPICIVRAPWFYGPNQPKRQKLFFDMIRKGKIPIIGNGNNKRSMVHTSNLSLGILLCSIRKEANNDIFWIADKTPYSFKQIIETIENLLEKNFNQKCKKNYRYFPSIISDLAFMIDKIIQFLGLYHQKIHVLSEMNKSIACSIKKAQKKLGYNPKVSLKPGMHKSLEEIYD